MSTGLVGMFAGKGLDFAKDFINNERGQISSRNKKAEILFALEAGGKSKFPVDTLIVRVGNENVAINRSAYEQLIKFTENGQVKTAQVMGAGKDSPILFLHPETNKILATIKPEKIQNGEINAQATNYFENFKEETNRELVYEIHSNFDALSNNIHKPNKFFNRRKIAKFEYVKFMIKNYLRNFNQ